MERTKGSLAYGMLMVVIGLAGLSRHADAQATAEAPLDTKQKVEIGTTILPPGRYLIHVVPLEENRDLLQVTNEDRSKVLATLISVPHDTRAGEEYPDNHYVFYPSVAGLPKVLKTWYEPDRTVGHDIVYPHDRALELAALYKQNVVSVPNQTKEAELRKAPLTVVSAEKQEKPYTRVAERKPDQTVAESTSPTAKQLPRTASDVPAYALLGILALGGALGLHMLAKRTV